MNYWKYIILSMLAACMVFHLSAVYYISGRNFELTSSDYYAQEQVYQQTMEKYRAGRDWHLQHRIDETQRLLVHLEGPTGDQQVAGVAVTLMRPNGSAADLQLTLAPVENGWWVAEMAQAPAAGNWHLGVEAETDSGAIAFRRQIRVD